VLDLAEKKRSFTRLLEDLARVDRFAYLGVAATLLIALASLTPWVRIPAGVWYGEQGEPHVVAAASGVEWLWRAVGLVVCSTIGIVVARRSWTSPALRVVVWGYLFFLVCFPSALSYFEPQLGARGRSVFWGVERTVADMESNFFHQETSWRRFQTFSEDAVRTVETAALPGAELGWNVLHLSQWPHVVVYHLSLPLHVLQSISFAPLFAFLAAIALAIAVHCSSADGNEVDGRRQKFVRRKILALGGIALVFVLGPKLASSWAFARAGFAEGRLPLEAEIAYLNLAIRFDPGQRFSLAVMARLGRKYRNGNLPDAAPAFASRTYDLLRAGRYRAALAEIQAGRRAYPDDESLQFFESVAFEEAGRAAFDQGQTSEALRYWRQSESPARLSPFAFYGESLAALRNDDVAGAERALLTALGLQRSLGFQRLTLGGQAYLVSAWRMLRERRAAGDIHAAFARAFQPDRW
jgi:hypothetical protein